MIGGERGDEEVESEAKGGEATAEEEEGSSMLTLKEAKSSKEGRRVTGAMKHRNTAMGSHSTDQRHRGSSGQDTGHRTVIA